MGAPILDALAQRASASLEKQGLKGLYSYWVKSGARSVEDNIPELGKVLTSTLRYFKETKADRIGKFLRLGRTSTITLLEQSSIQTRRLNSMLMRQREGDSRSMLRQRRVVFL